MKVYILITLVDVFKFFLSFFTTFCNFIGNYEGYLQKFRITYTFFSIVLLGIFIVNHEGLYVNYASSQNV